VQSWIDLSQSLVSSELDSFLTKAYQTLGAVHCGARLFQQKITFDLRTAAIGAKRSFDEAGGLLYLLDRLRGLTTIERC